MSLPAPELTPGVEPAATVGSPASIGRVRELAAPLRQLGKLHAAGVLTDAEFAQAKGRVIA